MKKKVVKNPTSTKPMPNVHEIADDSAGGFHGPGLNVPKQPKNYKKGK